MPPAVNAAIGRASAPPGGAAKKKKKGRKRVRCGHCGASGHTVRSCEVRKLQERTRDITVAVPYPGDGRSVLGVDIENRKVKGKNVVVVVDNRGQVPALATKHVETGMQVVSVASNGVSRVSEVQEQLQKVSAWPVVVVFRELPLQEGQELYR